MIKRFIILLLTTMFSTVPAQAADKLASLKPGSIGVAYVCFRNLFFLKARPFLKFGLDFPIDGYERDVVHYHTLLLAQAGLIDF